MTVTAWLEILAWLAKQAPTGPLSLRLLPYFTADNELKIDIRSLIGIWTMMIVAFAWLNLPSKVGWKMLGSPSWNILY